MEDLKREIIEKEERLSKKWLMIAIIEQAEEMGDDYTLGLGYQEVENIANKMLEQDCLWTEIKKYMRERITEIADEFFTEFKEEEEEYTNGASVLIVNDLSEDIDINNREEFDYCKEDLDEAIRNNEYLVYNLKDERLYEVTEEEYKRIESV